MVTPKQYNLTNSSNNKSKKMRKVNSSKKRIAQLLILWCLSWIINANVLIAQVTLANQQAINNFPQSTTHITGGLNIGGAFVMSDITNLSPLSNIVSVGGDLNITFNGQLTSLNGLGNIQSVGGRLFITNNANLSACDAILSLIARQGLVINNNSSGCNSLEEIEEKINECGGIGNNQDSDGDGVLDCADGCPYNPRKTVNDACGCDGDYNQDTDGDGVLDCADGCPDNPSKTVNDACGCDGGYAGDTDGDGTIDCEDGCPYDKNKIAAGNCGCGNTETPDTDGDGVYDCNDACPGNPYLSEKGICGCEAPVITHVSMSQENCNDQNTNDNLDDTYQATVRVTFDYPPKLGAIRFKGATNHRFNFSNENDDQTEFNFNLTFSADGKKVDFTVEYIGNESCNYRFQQATNLPPCSDLVCDVPHNLSSKITANQVFINWDYVADWMSYEYRYRRQGTTEWTYQWTDQNEVTICNLVEEQTYEYGIRAYCGNERKSDYALGQFTASLGKTPCLASEASSDCTIQNLEIVDIYKCYDRGTVYPLDDYFLADVVVYFQNPPTSGTFSIVGNTTVDISTSELQNKMSYRFKRLKIMENGGEIDLTATFSTNNECQFNINYPIPPNPCYLGSRSRSSKMDGFATTNDWPMNNQFSISPNPAIEELTINHTFTQSTKSIQLSIFNLQGQVVFQQTLAKDQPQVRVDIGSLTKGMYYLQLDNGLNHYMEKFLKL